MPRAKRTPRTKTDRPPEASGRWDDNAEKWAAYQSKGDSFRNELMWPATLDLLGPVRGRELLEVGCGEGGFSRKLATLGANVTALDYSAAMIRAARAARGPGWDRVEYMKADINRLPARLSGRFDQVCAMMCLMNIPGYRRAIAELAKTLRPGGRLVWVVTHPLYSMTSPHYLEESVRLWRFFPDQVEPTPVFHRSVAHYFAACTDAGLMVQQLVEVPFDVGSPMPGALAMACTRGPARASRR